MKKIILTVIAIIVMCGVVFAGDVYVNGYYRDTNHDGIKDSYVNGHYRTAPNDTIRDNYSTYPNTNPYTGERGTRNPNNNSLGNSNSGYNYNSNPWNR